jgi:putative tryptophan/tyrosine transport system substrate-binding protein
VPAGPLPLFESFRQELGQLGWTDGQNLQIELRSADGDVSRLPAIVADLLALPVDALVVIGGAPTTAAVEATSTVPIVMLAEGGEALPRGFVESLAKPGGNVTGVTLLGADLSAKRLELLLQAVPHVSRVGVLWNPTSRVAEAGLDATEQAFAASNVEPVWLPVRSVGEIEQELAAAPEQRIDALFLIGDPLLFSYRKLVADLAISLGLPTICTLKAYVDAGCLIGYGPDYLELRRRGAIHVDKVLRGTKPSEIPVERPRKFELTLNIITAEQIGVTFPRSIMQFATDAVR